MKVGWVSCLFLCVVSWFAAAVTIAQESTPENEYAALWQKVAEVVETRFYDPKFAGHDWPAIHIETAEQIKNCQTLDEARKVIDAAVHRLETSHTAFYTDEVVEYFYLLDIFSSGPLGEEILKRFSDGEVSYTGIGIFSESTPNGTFVTGVVDGSPAAVAGIRRGMKLLTVDGTPFSPVISFRDKQDVAVTIRVQTSANEQDVQELQVTPIRINPKQLMLAAIDASAIVKEVDGKRIGYVHLWSYAGEHYHQKLKDVLANQLKDADALVLDIRDGWGGASPEYLNLFNRNIPLLAMQSRDGQTSQFDSQWRKPVALLVNSGSRSGKEVLAYGFKKYAIGPVVGERTGGAVVAGSPFLIGDHAALYLAVSGVTVDGEVLEGKGVEPDVAVPFPLEFGTTEDPQIEAAMKTLADQLNQ
ncbi:MAG: S41 family peptidase [Pirellulaceae bacterium]